ncbi:beta-1,6-N-acetylglucosaminyltransferase [Bifidobacterium cebidarum]|uniref:Peptide O-xylosyltransferase n=1 Tax=Bifidobacterium cebidarum TaxID=2650773 RepID=A0A6I1GF26_9BIFI|nr:beta-1,6-N-acetylglucosaminyltransferase [Bifidobacterium cebidarum]KAB7788137.1 branching protein [Bifidobacterium cebidarum]
MQALIITCYKDSNQLIKLIESTCKNFLVYVHVDKKSTIDLNYLIKKKFPNTTIISNYSINWGGMNHLLAIIDLIHLALKDQRTSFIHIISAQDIPTKSPSEFKQKFEHSEKIYMECIPQHSMPPQIVRRIENWIPSANFESRKTPVRVLNMSFYIAERVLHLTRKQLGEYRNTFKGQIWCSIPRHVAQYVLDYINSHKNFMRSLKHTIIPEEFFFQTIIANSPYKSDIIDNDLRYVDWTYRNGSGPAILDETDYEKILSRNAFFARKIDLTISKKLIALIEAKTTTN